MSQPRVGYYCWGGPGLIRMTNLKYFHPSIDVPSLMQTYEPEYLQQVQETFGITDIWVTYSWGFGLETEQEDYDFILKKLRGMQQLGLKVHAYVQGPNLVYQDYADTDWWARDERGSLIAYHRGRKVTCLNNPGFQEYFFEKVRRVSQLPFDGVFVDNIQMGKLGVPFGEGATRSFVGCSCQYCQRLFGQSIPRTLRHDDLTAEYLAFRVACTTRFMQQTARIVHEAGKEFGSNSFDPQFETKYTYGTDLQALDKIQDYLLFENHALPDEKLRKNNLYLQHVRQKLGLHKPTFVVSYKKGIGFDSSFSQEEIDRHFTEIAQTELSVCLKGSEYLTDGIWHNLDPAQYRAPKLVPDLIPKLRTWQRRWRKRRLLFKIWFFDWVIARFGPRVFTLYLEKKSARRTLAFLQHRLIG